MSKKSKELFSEIFDELLNKNIKYRYPSLAPFNPFSRKFIVVGDNPGIKEYENNKYFIGPSGQELKDQFESKKITEDFYSECILRNKTFLHTARTNDLREIRKKIGAKLFNKTQEICAIEIAELANNYNLPILIFGKSHLGPGLLFETFWNILIENVEALENVFVFNHPAPPHYRFRDEWNRYSNVIKENNNTQVLKKIGSINRSLIETRFNQHNSDKKQEEPIQKRTDKFRFFFAEHMFHQNGTETWPKIFVLSADGKLYSEFLDFNRPATFEKTFDYNFFEPSRFKWNNYQEIEEITEEEALKKSLINQKNWVTDYIKTK